jgi:cation-transporting P-type ATPase E
MTTAALGVLDGLTDAQVAERTARGLTNDVPETASRSTRDIVRANVVTRFNILLGALLVVILAVAPIQDALFGIVLIVNTAIGIVQELRAKQTLDRLALLNAPRARVVRAGSVGEVAVDEVVLDDVLELHSGDQLVVDGELLAGNGLEIDESLLTGESDPVAKAPGDEVLSGSFVVAGTGRYRATRVGREAYATRLAEEAKRFTLVRSELRAGIDWILAAVSWSIAPTIAILFWSQLRLDVGIKEALRSGVAGTVGMVPQGLVLLTSVAFAIGVIRLGRRNVLVQELPAVEGLARVDTVCFDKTGTLTEGRLSVRELELLGGRDAAEPLGALAAADPQPNATLAAIAAAYPPPAGWTAADVVPFSSARKWSAASFPGAGTWVLGAPDVVLGDDEVVAGVVETHTSRGHRVVALARTDAVLDGRALPAGLEGVALVALGDTVRSDAADTLRYFAEQGVAAKVISGDHPRTVAAIAAEVGVPGASRPVDGRKLPEDPEELATVMEEHSVFGRVSPHQKRAMVAALQSRGHVVAMTGDGVNDVLALKDSDIGIAVGSGSSASRAVAQLVLMDGRFDTLPGVVGEGRRVISNIERVANLFVTKTVYAFILALSVGLLSRPFPFLPRHLTLVSTVTIGTPAFFLALSPTARRARSGFVRRVLMFAIPAGIAAAAATLGAYELAIIEETTLIESRTIATMVLAAVGMFALGIVSRPLTPPRRWLIGSMAALLVLAMLTPVGQGFFELNLPRAAVLFAGLGIVALTGTLMYGSLVAVGWLRQVPDLLRPEVVQPWWRRTRQSVAEFRGEWSWDEVKRRLRFWDKDPPPPPP